MTTGGPGLEATGVSNRLAAGWSAGAITTSLTITLFGLLLLPFLTTRLGMAAGVAGALISLNKMLGLGLDPLVGWLSDRTSSPIGRRRPYILAGALLLPASLVALFWPPSLIDTPLRQLTYYTAAILLFGLAYSVMRVPYLTMSAEMTSSGFIRARMIAFKIVAISVGTLLGTSLAPALVDLFGADRRAYGLAALILGLCAAAAGLACFFATRRARFIARSLASGKGTLRDFRSMFRNTPFIALVGAKSIFAFGATFQASCSAYFVLFVMNEHVGMLAYYYLVMTLVTVASQPIWLRCVRAYGKRGTFIGASLLFAASAALWLWLAVHPALAGLIAVAAFAGLAMGGAQLALESILPDIMTLDAEVSGHRREGVFASLFSVSEKLVGAVAILIVGVYLDRAGFIQSTHDVAQPRAVLLAISLALSVIPAAAAVLAALIFLRWGLRDQIAPSIAASFEGP